MAGKINCWPPTADRELQSVSLLVIYQGIQRVNGSKHVGAVSQLALERGLHSEREFHAWMWQQVPITDRYKDCEKWGRASVDPWVGKLWYDGGRAETDWSMCLPRWVGRACSTVYVGWCTSLHGPPGLRARDRVQYACYNGTS